MTSTHLINPQKQWPDYGTIIKTQYKLLPHQEIGVKWLSDIEINKKIKGGILGDDMGLGKTLQIISLIKLRPEKTLIIVPSSLLFQWKSEFKKFFPEKHIHILWGKHYPDTSLLKFDDTYIIISTYGTIRRKNLSQFNFNRIVCDEAHTFRNRKSKIFQRLIKIPATYKWCLTGTPIHNYISDITSLMTFVGFVDRFSLETLRNFTHHHMIRRTKQSLNLDIPKLTVETTELETEDDNFYNFIDTSGFETCLLEKLLRLKQACVFPQMLVHSYNKKYNISIEDEFISNKKTDYIIDQIISKNHRCVVFTAFNKEMDYIKLTLLKKNPSLNIKCISGKTSLEDRSNYSKDKTIDILLVQINTGGVGLNLQIYDTAYFTNLHYNPTIHQQAIARLYRLGQKKPVKIHIIKNKHTIEERIHEINQKKIDMINDIIIR